MDKALDGPETIGSPFLKVSLAREVAAMRRPKASAKQALKVERIFESSRMGSQAMATSYEAVIPITRKTLAARPNATTGERVSPQGRALIGEQH